MKLLRRLAAMVFLVVRAGAGRRIELLVFLGAEPRAMADLARAFVGGGKVG